MCKKNIWDEELEVECDDDVTRYWVKNMDDLHYNDCESCRYQYKEPLMNEGGVCTLHRNKSHPNCVNCGYGCTCKDYKPYRSMM